VKEKGEVKIRKVSNWKNKKRKRGKEARKKIVTSITKS